MAVTCTTELGDSDETARDAQAAALSAFHADNEMKATMKAFAPPESTVPWTKLKRSPTIRSQSDKKPRATKPSDYLTPKRTGRSKKKKRTEMPPPAPKIKPVPHPMTAFEVIDLTRNDAKVLYDLTGESATTNIVDMSCDTPGRVTKIGDDVLISIEGIELSMNECI